MSFAAHQMLGNQKARVFQEASKRWTTVFYSAFNTSYAYARLYFEPALGRGRFDGTDGGGIGNTYTGTITFADASTRAITGKGDTQLLLDGWPNAPHNVADGWHIRFRQNGSLTMPILRDQADASFAANTWFPWNQTFQAFNYRPSTTQLQVYALVDFSNDGGATIAFTLDVTLRSTSA